MASFSLHPQIEIDSFYVTDLELSQVRLHKNAAFPWIMLIPKVDVIELVDMQVKDQQLLMHEICQASAVMRNLYKPSKLNIATIGNAVSQIHVHVVARYNTDKAWPKTVWYCGVEKEYTKTKCIRQVQSIKNAFENLSCEVT